MLVMASTKAQCPMTLLGKWWVIVPGKLPLRDRGRLKTRRAMGRLSNFLISSIDLWASCMSQLYDVK